MVRVGRSIARLSSDLIPKLMMMIATAVLGFEPTRALPTQRPGVSVGTIGVATVGTAADVTEPMSRLLAEREGVILECMEYNSVSKPLSLGPV